MPTVPLTPEGAVAPGAFPTNPLNFLMAAAEAKGNGTLPSAPVPTGHPLQTGKPSPHTRSSSMRIVK